MAIKKAKPVGAGSFSFFRYRPLPMLGFILIAIGIIWLGKELGWIPASLPVWPVVLIIIGIVMILNRMGWKRIR